MDWLVRNVASDWVVFDYGAGTGPYSILLAKLAATGLVYSFEHPRVIEMLRRNLIYQGIDNVRTCSAMPFRDFDKAEEDKRAKCDSHNEGREESRYISIDRFVKAEDLDRLDCIRIDMNSLGPEDLQGAKDTLLRFDPWVMLDFEYTHDGEDRDVRQVLPWMRELNYTYAWVCNGKNFIVKRCIPEHLEGRMQTIGEVLKELEKPVSCRSFPKFSSLGREEQEPLPIDGQTAARAYWDHRRVLAEVREQVRLLHKAVGYETYLLPFQYGQLIAMALEFKPDLILEFGECTGHATCALVQASHLLGVEKGCSVTNVCNPWTWRQEVEPRLRDLLPASWFEPLTLLGDDPAGLDFESILNGKQRVMLYWYDQSLSAQRYLLGKILPMVAERPHLVLVHNLFDSRHISPDSYQYGENVWWKSGTIGQDIAHFGHYCGAAGLAAPLMDFLSRNRVEAYSADHSYAEGFQAYQIDEMHHLFGEDGNGLFRTCGYWAYFSLNTGGGPFIFPASDQDI